MTVQFVDDERMVAEVHRFANEVSVIRISRPASSELAGLASRSANVLGPRLDDSNLEWTTDYMALLAVRVVYYHEFAHVVRGHLHELAQRTGQLQASFSWSESQQPLRGCVRFTKWMERDADIVGADFFSMMTALPTWAGRAQSLRVMFARMCLLAAGITLVYLEQRRDDKLRSQVHDDPYLRWIRYVDALGGSLARELKLTDDMLFGAARQSFEDLASLARDAAIPKKLWAIEDLDGFKRALTRHGRIVKRYIAGQARYMGNRSSLLPDVAGTTHGQVESARARLESS